MLQKQLCRLALAILVIMNINVYDLCGCNWLKFFCGGLLYWIHCAVLTAIYCHSIEGSRSHLPDVDKTIAVKTNTVHNNDIFLTVVDFLHLKMIIAPLRTLSNWCYINGLIHSFIQCSVNVTIFWRYTTSRSFYNSWPDSPMMFQQTRSSRPVAKLKMASGHHPTGGALEADLSPHGSIRSTGTREYWWLMLSSWLGTDRFGGKSQWRDATADHFASWWWWWWWT